MKRKPSPAMILISLAVFLSITGSAFAAHRVRHAAYRYVHHAVSRHVWDCHRSGMYEHMCNVRLITGDSILKNGKAIDATYHGNVFVMRTPYGYRCTFDPRFYAWDRC